MSVIRLTRESGAVAGESPKGARALVVLAAVWLAMALGVAGWQLDLLPSVVQQHFDPDGERKLFALVSAAALICASISVAVAWRRRALPGTSFILGAVLAGMTVDEWLELHERFERRLEIDWNALYLPIVVCAGLSGLIAVRRLWPERSSFLLLAGGGCWFAAYLLEDLQWDAADRMHPNYVWMMIPEELLEIGGSLLLTAAAVLACCEMAAVDRRRPSPRALAPQPNRAEGLRMRFVGEARPDRPPPARRGWPAMNRARVAIVALVPGALLERSIGRLDHGRGRRQGKARDVRR
ncbi:MAG TPA: hypothetical protein VK988_14940 [Acidimicrobiales bacterium]|nr:hypothetical protein [Acidimicrobiales bacterium]